MESKTAQEDYKRVKDDLETLQADLAKLTKAVAEGQKSKVSDLRDELRREGEEALNDFRDRGEKSFARARKAGDKAIEGAGHRIEERPFLTVLIAFVAGLLLGKFFDR